MGIYKRKDSPFWWLHLERPGRPAIAESSKIPVRAATKKGTQSNRRLAEEAYHARMADLARASYNLPTATPAPDVRLFRDQVDWYTENRIPRLKSESSRERESMIAARLRADFGDRGLAQVDPELVAEWRTRRLRDVSPATVNREVDVCKAILQTAVPKYLPASPLFGMKRLRVEPVEPRILTPQEEARLLDELAVDDRAILLCALDSLTRLRDVLELRRDNVGPVQDHGRYILLLNPKNGRRKKKPISKRLRAALDQCPDVGPYYFRRRRVAKTDRDRRGAVRDFLEAACKRAGIPYGRRRNGITFHTATKHTGASRMIDRGINPRYVQTIGEWSSLELVSRYTHPNEDSLENAVESIGVSPLPPPPPSTDDQIATLEAKLADLRRKQKAEAAERRRRFRIAR